LHATIICQFTSASAQSPPRASRARNKIRNRFGCATRKPRERRRPYFLGPLITKSARVLLGRSRATIKMHMMRSTVFALSADLHRHFFSLLRTRRRTSQGKHFIRVIMLRFRRKIRPRESLNRMLARRIKKPGGWRRIYAGESLISGQPLFFSLGMIFSLHGEPEQTRAFRLRQVHAK